MHDRGQGYFRRMLIQTFFWQAATDPERQEAGLLASRLLLMLMEAPQALTAFPYWDGFRTNEGLTSKRPNQETAFQAGSSTWQEKKEIASPVVLSQGYLHIIPSPAAQEEGGIALTS